MRMRRGLTAIRPSGKTPSRRMVSRRNLIVIPPGIERRTNGFSKMKAAGVFAKKIGGV
jgi:hypothetical protein